MRQENNNKRKGVGFRSGIKEINQVFGLSLVLLQFLTALILFFFIFFLGLLSVFFVCLFVCFFSLNAFRDPV